MHPHRLFASLALAAAVAVSFAGRAEGQEGAAKPDANGFIPLTVDPPYALDTSGKHGGTLIWAELGELDTFHPLVSSSATNSELKTLIFDTLVSYDNAKWEHTASLAWKWEHSDDGKTWTFHLRKGVKWSDGAPFTSADVLFSFATVFHPKIENSDVDGFKIGDSPLPTLEAKDDHTVEFHCSAVDALFLMHVGTVVMVPNHLWGDTLKGESPTYASVMGCGDPSKVVGTGPFRVVSYANAEKVVYERNPYSWRTDKAGARLPYLGGVIVKLVKDMNTRSLQFLNGDFDMINDIQASDYAQFKAKEKDGAFTMHRLGLSLNTNYIVFNQHPGTDPQTKQPFVAPFKLKWFQDTRFRRAMSHAVDRENLVKLLLDGKGGAIYGETTKANKTWYTETTTFPYDVAKANALLDAMGLAKRDKDGVRMDAEGHRVSIEMMTNVENDTRVKVIAQIKNDWAAVGVEGVLHPVNFNELVSQLEDGHKWESIVLGWGSGVPPDPLNGKNIILSSARLHVWYPQQEKPCNEWEAACDAIVNEMSSEIDEGKRRLLWAKFLEKQAEEQPIIYLYASNAYAASKPRVKNMRASVLRPSTNWNVEELWLDDGK